MSLTFDETVEQIRAASTSTEVDVDDDDDTSPYIYDDTDFTAAMDLIHSAMKMLGFYGDKNLSGNIVLKDRERMIKLADSLRDFINTISVAE